MLTEKQISEITNLIISNFHPEKMYLYGSYSNGTANENSDIDLLIIKNTDIPFYKRARQVRLFFSRQPAPFDILVYTPDEFESRKTLINHIAYIVNKEGKLIYER